MKFHAEGEYPIPKVEQPNIEYANILKQNYTGNISELTTILLYIFQHNVVESIDKEIATAMRQIAIVEMHHLELLGKTIALLGVKPSYKIRNSMTGNLMPWTADNINYTINIKEMIEYNIKEEKENMKNYTEAITKINDPFVQKLLKRIILDEQIHIKFFETLKEKYSIRSI